MTLLEGADVVGSIAAHHGDVTSVVQHSNNEFFLVRSDARKNPCFFDDHFDDTLPNPTTLVLNRSQRSASHTQVEVPGNLLNAALLAALQREGRVLLLEGRQLPMTRSEKTLKKQLPS